MSVSGLEILYSRSHEFLKIPVKEIYLRENYDYDSINTDREYKKLRDLYYEYNQHEEVRKHIDYILRLVPGVIGYNQNIEKMHKKIIKILNKFRKIHYKKFSN